MNQNILTTFSLVSIKYFEDDQEFYLANKSFIRDNVFLTSNKSAKDFQNSLFYVQTGSSQNQLKSAIQFGQKVLFRHKISNKYLSHSDQFQEEENDTTYKLILSHQKHQFKILPCFQYQTKISTRIRFNQDVHLVTQINGAKNGYLSTKKSNHPDIRNTILGINQHNSISTSKFSFHLYYEYEKGQQCYTFGSIVWISHIQSTTFLSCKTIKNKRQLTFQPIQYEKDLQSINGLWLIQSDKFTQGGKLLFQSKFRLKNLSTGTYMSFSGNFKMNQNQRIYSITLDQFPSQKSQYVFKSLKGQGNVIKKNSYLILRHNQSKLYIGCRKNNTFADSQTLKPISYSQFSDEDLFKIIQLGQNQDQALRFVLSIRQQLEYIQNHLGKQANIHQMQQDKQIFTNIRIELQKLKNFQKLFQKIQGQISQYIPILCELLIKYRSQLRRDGQNLDIIVQILKLIYEILIIICCQNRKNQEQLYGYISYFVEDIFLGLGAENALIQIFKSNYKVLYRASKPLSNFKNMNIIQATFHIVQRFSKQKNNIYWQKLLKIIQFLFTLINDNQSSIDVNQRIISQQFFQSHQMFAKIFFGIKISNHRIKVQQQPGKFVEIDRITNHIFLNVVQQVFKLFSMLAYHRNFISKKFIHQFLSAGCTNNIQVLIAYLNMPINQKLLNNFYSFITNLYIDSSPRINRQKPLSVVNFSLQSSPRSAAEQQHELSDRMKTALLAHLTQQYQSRPLQISNILSMSGKLLMEPTLSQDQLALYKQEINQKLRRQVCSVDLLSSVKVLIQLESYTEAELKDIFKTLKNKLQQGNLSPQSIKGIMQIFIQISIYTRQAQMKKMTAYLKYKYRMKQLTINYQKQYQYLLPFDKKLLPSAHYPQDINQSISNYNNQVDLLKQIWPCSQLNKILLNLIISQSNQNNLQYLQQIYNCLIVQAFHKKMFTQLILNSIVVTSEQSQTFSSLFQLYKKIKHLTSISQYWLCGPGQNKENIKCYVKYMIQVTNYLHQNYQGSSQYSGREIKIQNDYTRSIIREEEIYVNRQLLLRNIGFHKLVLQLLQANYFLLEIKNSDDKSNQSQMKAQQVFSLCFQFIYGFIYNCNETKDIIHKAWNILDKFQNLVQVGQTRVYRELYKNNVQYIREIKKTFIQRIVHKILKNTKSKSNEGCQFNPQYLRYIQAIVKINGECHKNNLQKFYRLIQKQSIFRKIMYGNQNNQGKLQLCLDMFSIKTQCVQVPFIYHLKILGLICDMVDSLDSQSTIIKSKLRNIFNFNYLIRILAMPDIYTHIGLQAQMIFLLKKQVRRIVYYMIERNDSIRFLHDNEEIINLLDFYYRTFIQRPKKVKQQFLNEALYMPYFTQYQEQIKFFENNQRKYFQEQIVQFLNKIMAILKKTQKSVIITKINAILQEYDDQKMVEYFQFRKIGHSIDKVNLRWLNFVDRDQNNSPQQKFAKLSVVDLLRSDVTKKVLQNQNKQFYKLISEQAVQFTDVLIRLISMNMQQEYKQNDSQTTFSEIHMRLVLLRNILFTRPTKQKKAEQIVYLIQRGVVQNFVSFCIKIDFDFSKSIIRKIFHQILKIFIFILSNSSDTKAAKQLYRCLSQNQLCFRFWSHLTQSILTVSQNSRIEKPLQQVNWCLSNIYLNGEAKNQNIYEQSLIFIQKLCEYHPFTKFLRYQPLYPSKDFLQILYHTLYFVLVRQNKMLNITVSTVEAAQKIVKCIVALMIGRNQTNQNYLVDSKFPQIVTQVLKIQNIRNNKNKADEAERQRLVDQVIQFYQRNGIDLSKDLKNKISVLDFSHSYVLNRLKYSLLKTLIQALAGNQRSINKLKFQIPIQLIKINLIWIYQQFKTSGLQYDDNLIFKQFYDWDQINNIKDLNGIFLMIGFYLFYMIEIFGEENNDRNQDQDNSAQDKQKKKQKIVSKFFNTISEKNKQKQKLEKLQNQPFGEQMRKFYESYYQALQFFKQRTLTIEVNFVDELTKVYFPKIPICNKMSQQIIQEFKTDAVRISQQQKIKSLLQFQQECYDKFLGEEQFLKNFQNIPILSRWFIDVTEDRVRFIALVMCLIQTILFLVQNFGAPNFVFNESIILNPDTTIEYVMLILGIINLLLGADLFFFLIFKKAPILFTIQSQKQKNRADKQRQKIFNGRKGYLFKNTVPQLLFTLIYIFLLVLSFVHPFFGSFILFDVMNRLQLGRQILRSFKETWFQLMMATILLIMFNYLFALFVYIQFSTPYGPACQVLYQCLLMLVDQSLKSGSGFYGTTNPINEGFIGQGFDLGFLSQMLYIIFAQKVMFQIFSGTIIDKFSQLREQAESVEQDQKTTCYICGQQRFVIDFQLQGYEQHVQQTHNPVNYVFYLFYLRKQDPNHYGIVDKFVYDCQQKQKKHWFPNQTSILKQLKQKQKQKEDQQDQQLKMVQFLDKKIKDIKNVRAKNAIIVQELKLDNSKSKLQS